LKDWHDVGKEAAKILEEVDQMELRQRNADRQADANATERGEWPPSQSEPAVSVPVNPRDLIIPGLGPITPPTVSDLPPEPSNAREILFAHMLGGLEMLRAMAMSREVPLGIRKDAAALLAKLGSSMMPKRSEHVSATLSRLQIEKIAGSLDQLPAESLAAMLGSEQPERPALTSATSPPTSEPIDVTPKHLAVRERMTVEERIRRALSRHKTLGFGQLRNQVTGQGWKDSEGWPEILDDMVRRGVLQRIAPTGLRRVDHYSLVKKVRARNGNGKVAG
jgi:hypothetical protein